MSSKLPKKESDNHPHPLSVKVGRMESRKLKSQAEKNKDIWFGLGTIGMVGWSLALPPLLGVALGRWLDSRWPGNISWTLTFFLIGLLLGCVNAWHWVKRQSRPGTWKR